MPKVPLTGRRHKSWILYGEPSSGKSFSVLKFFENHPEYKKLYILDVDAGINSIIGEFSADVVNRIEYYIASTWKEIMQAYEEIGKLITTNDIFLVEQLDTMWAMVQANFCEEVYKEDLSDYLLELRKKIVETMSNRPATLDMVDWVVVKKMHNFSFLEPAMKKWPCMTVCTSPAGEIIRIGKERAIDKAITNIYSPIGLKIAGEKHVPYLAEHILFLSTDGRGNFFVQCIKNRGSGIFGKTLVPKDASAIDMYFIKDQEFLVERQTEEEFLRGDSTPINGADTDREG